MKQGYISCHYCHLRYTVYTALYMASQTFDDKLKNAIDKILNWQFRVLYRKKPMLVV